MLQVPAYNRMITKTLHNDIRLSFSFSHSTEIAYKRSSTHLMQFVADFTWIPIL